MEHIDQYIRAILPALKDSMRLKRTELSEIEIADGDYSCPDRFCADGFTFRKFETDETGAVRTGISGFVQRFRRMRGFRGSRCICLSEQGPWTSGIRTIRRSSAF